MRWPILETKEYIYIFLILSLLIGFLLNNYSYQLSLKSYVKNYDNCREQLNTPFTISTANGFNDTIRTGNVTYKIGYS